MTFEELQEAFKSWCLDLTKEDEEFVVFFEDQDQEWRFNTIKEVEAFFVGFDFCMEQMMP